MSGKKNQPKVNIWDHRERSAVGTKDDKDIYEAVGRALSAWEGLQSTLTLLFCGLQGGQSFGLYRAIGTQMNVPPKLEMLNELVAATELDEDVRKATLDLSKVVKEFNERRNEIAHGVVMRIDDCDYFLIPAFSTTRKRKSMEIEDMAYMLTSRDVLYFRDQFLRLEDLSDGLVDLISTRTQQTESH